MKTAVIYARYSSDSQSEQSIDGQLRVCNEYAKNNDIIIVNTYIDRAMTGTNDNRPDFQRMLKDSKRKEWDYVLVYKFDRFSRNKLETGIHKKTLKDNGVKLISATEYIPDSPEAIILESMLEGYAEYYSAELSQKVKRGLKESRIKGNFTGGHVPYGFKVENHKVIIEEAEAEVIRYIFKEYMSGRFAKDIAKDLERKGVYRNGQRITTSYIYKILQNEKYSGIYRYNNEIFTNIYPQIIPTDIFEKIRTKTIKNKHGGNSVNINYLLRQKLICGYCGEKMNAETGTSRLGEVKRYYKCFTKKRGNHCEKQQVRKDVLEKYVLDNIKKYLTNKDNLNYIADTLLKLQSERLKANVVLMNLLREKKQTENAIQNILTAIENGGTSGTVMKRMRELEERNENLEREIIIEKSKSDIKLTKEMIIDYFKESLCLEPQMLISVLVKEIVVFNDKVIITYNMPREISPDESRGYCLFKDNIKFPIYIQKKKIPYMIDFILEMQI